MNITCIQLKAYRSVWSLYIKNQFISSRKKEGNITDQKHNTSQIMFLLNGNCFEYDYCSTKCFEYDKNLFVLIGSFSFHLKFR